ncbi:MAG TPA: DoxX family membrane protein [Anaeromyxobacter sp.]|nr:DoxX family membrane protein [Anaeromyxobacter sp.]
MDERRSEIAYHALRVALGVVPLAAGADKFLNLLADWPSYLSPLAVRLLPVSPETFMRLAGIVEIVVGAAILLRFARIFAWVAMAWLAAIALELFTTGRFLDVAARDLVMATAAFALAKLAPAFERAPSRAHRPATEGTPAPRQA